MAPSGWLLYISLCRRVRNMQQRQNSAECLGWRGAKCIKLMIKSMRVQYRIVLYVNALNLLFILRKLKCEDFIEVCKLEAERHSLAFKGKNKLAKTATMLHCLLFTGVLPHIMLLSSPLYRSS